MPMLVLAAVLAVGTAVADDEPTYTLTVDVGGVWGKSWIEAIEAGLGRLEGVKSAKVGAKKSQFVLKVLENKSILSANVREALPEGYTFRGLSIEIAGTVAKDGDRFAFTARGSKQKFTLTANDELRKLVDAGKTTVAVSGKLTEKEKSSPAIEVSSAKAEK